VTLTQSTVKRGLVLLEPDASGEIETVPVEALVAIARCKRCKARARVLPCDVLPRKTYSATVIEHLTVGYARGDRSLRQVAWGQLGDRTPAHTTLHGWTEGLGAHVLGRPGGDAGGVPASRLVADAAARIPSVAAAMRAEVHVDPRRYRSEPRHERLAACVRMLAVVVIVAALPHPFAIAACRRLALAWSQSSVLAFNSRISSTAMEHRTGAKPARSGRTTPASRDRCPTRTRSPPGALSRSLP
jgi:hypothetical protein